MSIKQPIVCETDLAYPAESKLISVSHTDDINTEVIELTVKQDGAEIDLSGKTVTARYAAHSAPTVLINDNVNCAVSQSGHIMVPFDNTVLSGYSGEIDIEISISDGSDVLTLPYPLWVRVRSSILESAVISERTRGIVAELLESVRAELARIDGYTTPEEVFEILDDAFSGALNLSPALRLDNVNSLNEYILYFVDSDDERHELFNFSRFFAEKATTLAGYGITNAYTKAELDAALPEMLYQVVEDLAEKISESIEYFTLEAQTLDGVTVTDHGDGSYTFNGSNTTTTLFPAFTLPAGAYTARIEIVSGSGTAQGAIRYGTGSGELWISTNHTAADMSFNSATQVFFRLNHGEFTNWKMKISITQEDEITAVDKVARDGLDGVSEKVSMLDIVCENPNLFELESQVNDGITVTNHGDGSYTFNGTNSAITLFQAFTLPAGDYTAHIEAVSGTADDQGAIRYGTGSGELWISTNYSEESKSFESPTPVFFRLNTGTYTNWRLKIRIEKNGYVSAVDKVARDGLDGVSEKVSMLDIVCENPNLFILESQVLDGITVTNHGDGSYTFNGTNSAITLFQAFTLPAGDYTAHIEAVSGTADDQGAIRYGTGSGELWISTNQSEESKSFESPTPVFFRLNHGEFTNWRLKIRIEKNGYVSAVDSVARDGLEGKADLAIAEIVEAVTENNNYFDLNTQTVDGISAVKIDADTYEFTGTNSAATTFPEFYILAGTYIAKVEAVSGTATARAAIRYGEGNGSSWVTDNSTQPVQLTFNTRTRVFFRLNTGEYSSWRLKITIINVGAEYTAIDYKMREKFAENNEIVTALSGTVSGLELPVNHLSAYNAFTCVDKTKVKLTSATKILAFGDSITHGGSWGTPWVTFLSDIVGCTVSNYAVSGALFGEEVREEAKWISKQISAVTAADWLATTLVVIAAGTNDAGYSTTDSELAAKVQAAITAIKAKTNAPILFITPIKRGSADTDANYNKLPKISGIIENVALKNQCSVICGLNFPIPAHDNGVIENMMGEAGGYIHPNNTGGYVYAMCVIDAVMTQDVPYKTTSITSDSTDEQYPTAKAVYDAIQAAIASLT